MHARRISGEESARRPLLPFVFRTLFTTPTGTRRGRRVHREYLDAVLVVGAIALLLGFVTGCGTTLLPTDESAKRAPLTNGEVAPVQSPVYEDGNDNSEFTSAQPATLPADGEIVIEGAIEVDGDIDVYTLGPASAGDVVVADVTGNGGLNAVAALFNGESELIDANNDRSYYAGNLNPFISQTIRQDSPNLYLGVAASTATHFASSGAPTGSYSIRLSRRPAGTVNPPRPQLVWLDFEGGESVQIAWEPVVVMNTFSAEAMSSRYAGQTDYIIDRLIAQMRQDLAPYNVTLLDSKHHTRPTEAHSRLFFGNYNASYLGLADSVDTGNNMLTQEAIIYSEDLAMFESLEPTVDEAAQALANIAAHELGHLLGLEHTSESGDLMATASSARQVLEVDAEYRRARLEPTIFPVGWQSSGALLLLNLGRSAANNGRWMLDDLIPASNLGPMRDAQGIPDIPFSMCGKCTGEGCR
ncbi:MAG TPA: matrixin family metalloprotease [Phycisphaerae bacterium]|nr:matrixin family metalloprotease [Phycisphaerae bacterium]